MADARNISVSPDVQAQLPSVHVRLGADVLDFFGVSIPAVQVAGGMVVCAIAWSLLNRPDSPATLSRAAEPATVADDLRRRAFYPLTEGVAGLSVGLRLRGVKAEEISRGQVLAAPKSITRSCGMLIYSMACFLVCGPQTRT